MAFEQPFHADRVGLIYTRTYNELKGVTNDMEKTITRILSEGMVAGDGPRKLARKMTAAINGPGKSLEIKDSLGRVIPAKRRAMMIARTEIMRAHHAATMVEYTLAKAEGVRIQVEMLTAGDDRVCPTCAGLAEETYTLKEAEGLLPVHPLCRCVAKPVFNWNIDQKSGEGEQEGEKKATPKKRSAPKKRSTSKRSTSKATSEEPSKDLETRRKERAARKLKEREEAYRPFEPSEDYFGDISTWNKRQQRKYIDKVLNTSIVEYDLGDGKKKLSKKELEFFTGSYIVNINDHVLKVLPDNVKTKLKNSRKSRLTLYVEPGAHEKGGLQTVHHGRILPNAAGAMDTHGNMYLNAGSPNMKDRGALIAMQSKMGGRVSTADWGTVIRHEYGHHVYNVCLRDNRYLREKWQRFYDQNQTLFYAVTDYATSNHLEGFAEVFSYYTHKSYKKKGDRLPKKIEEFFEEIMGEI